MKSILAVLAIAMTVVMSANALTRLDVGTYNLRNKNDGDAQKGNGWDVRKTVVAQLLQYHEFDIFGTQE